MAHGHGVPGGGRIPDGLHAPAAPDAAAAALWLWRAHNAVNRRLNASGASAAAAASRRLSLPKVAWPEAWVCAECRDRQTGQWVESSVVRHLGATYCLPELSPCMFPTETLVPRWEALLPSSGWVLAISAAAAMGLAWLTATRARGWRLCSRAPERRRRLLRVNDVVAVPTEVRAHCAYQLAPTACDDA